MKFTQKDHEHPENKERVKRWFALLPVRLYKGDLWVTRWLEWVTVKQIFTWYQDGEAWVNTEFVD